MIPPPHPWRTGEIHICYILLSALSTSSKPSSPSLSFPRPIPALAFHMPLHDKRMCLSSSRLSSCAIPKSSQRLLRRVTYSSRRLRERSRLLDDDSCWPLSRTRDELQTRLQEPPSVLRDILTNGRFQILHDILANGRLHLSPMTNRACSDTCHFCDSNGGSLVSFAPLLANLLVAACCVRLCK